MRPALTRRLAALTPELLAEYRDNSSAANLAVLYPPVSETSDTDHERNPA